MNNEVCNICGEVHASTACRSIRKEGVCPDSRHKTLMEMSEQAWDIGTVRGVLRGIVITPELRPHQVAVINLAIEAIERISKRNLDESARASRAILKP